MSMLLMGAGSSGPGSSALQANLLNYWKMEDTNWLDSHTYADTLTAVNSPTAVAGASGNAMSTVGGTAYLKKVGYTRLNGLSAFTIMFFCKATAFTNYNASYLSQSNDNDLLKGWRLDGLNAPPYGLRFRIHEAGVGISSCYINTEVFTAGIAAHVRVSVDLSQPVNADRVKLYKDGTLLSTNINDFSLFPVLPATTYDFMVGKEEGRDPYNGWIDELGFWSVALTDTQADLHRLKTEFPY